MSTSTPSPDSPSATSAGIAEDGRLLGGRYRLDELVASGGMAQVWRGTDEVLRRQVAVKLLHPHLAADGSFVTRFRQEAVAAARLAHPGIVAIYDTCSEAGTEAIVMELVPGRTLRERLDDPAPIDPWQAAGLAAQVAEALDAAHRAGLVHRDIKPANVLLAGDGRVKVADFGIAKAAEGADLTQPGLMVGTAKYVAPEQVEGKAGRRAHRHLQPRRRPLRDALRPAALRGRRRGGRRAGPPAARAAAAAPGAAERAEAARGRRLPRHGPRARPTATTAPPTCAPRCSRPARRPRADVDADLARHQPRRRARRSRRRPSPAARPIPPPPPGRRSAQTERSWLVPTVILVVIALALGVAGLLFGRSGAGDLIGGVRDAITGAPDPVADRADRAPPTSTPFGEPLHRSQRGDDQDDERRWRSTATRTRRGRPRATTTATSPCSSPASASSLDRGRARRARASSCSPAPPTTGRRRFYVADSDPGSFEGWGEPVATLEGIEAGTRRGRPRRAPRAARCSSGSPTRATAAAATRSPSQEAVLLGVPLRAE